jgi:hypothetical protein
LALLADSTVPTGTLQQLHAVVFEGDILVGVSRVKQHGLSALDSGKPVKEGCVAKPCLCSSK